MVRAVAVNFSAVCCLLLAMVLFSWGHGAERKTQHSCMRKWLKVSGIRHNVTADYEEKLLSLQLDETSLENPLAHRVLAFVFNDRTHQQQFLKCIFRQTEHCQQHPSCQNSGVCLFNKNSSSFTCKCPNTSFGNFCDKDVDECQLGLHNCSSLTSTCVNKNGGYICQCRPGFQKRGDKCEDINECLSKPPPCSNTTDICKNLRNDFKCVCKAGYTGRQCNQDLDECFSSPCQNGGTCYNKDNHFVCKCPIEFEGDTCKRRWFKSAMFRSILQKVDNISAKIDGQTNQILGELRSHSQTVEKQHIDLGLLQPEKTYLKRGISSCQKILITIPSFLKVSTTPVKAMVDVDGPGPLSPFQVQCVWDKTLGKFSTVLHHNHETRTHVKGYEALGSYYVNINYRHASLTQVIALVNATEKCKQFVKYECYHSLISQGYWKDRAGKIMKQWSSGDLTTATSTLCQSGGKCNCDINDHVWRSDEAYITDKEHLPITAVHFGDTGTTKFGEQGYHTVGPLVCF